MRGKIQSLLRTYPKDTVATTPWLEAHGISAQLRQKYVNSGWLTSMGYGAYRKLSEMPKIFGGVYALQSQLKLPIHVGALSALELRGGAHFLPMKINKRPLYLFSHAQVDRVSIPKWFVVNYPMNRKFDRRLFEGRVGVEDYELDNFSIKVSSLERALFEVLSLMPKIISFKHASLLFEGKRFLRINLLQNLLETTRSQVLKRLFLYFSQAHDLGIVKNLDLEKIDLGRGRRVVGDGKYYCAEYNLMLPNLIEDQDIPI